MSASYGIVASTLGWAARFCTELVYCQVIFMVSFSPDISRASHRNTNTGGLADQLASVDKIARLVFIIRNIPTHNL